MTLPVVLPVNVDEDRVNKDCPPHTLQMTEGGKGEDRGELMSNLGIASETVSEGETMSVIRSELGF